jgi:DNA topoisomerase-1
VNAGRFGPYVKYGDQFVSLAKGEEPLDVTMERALVLIREKQTADAPIALFEQKPVTKGKGRFGPYIKWDGFFINVPKRYNFDALSQSDIDELISTKIEKESNRFIVRWPDESIAIENGRWGAFIRFGKKMLKLDKKKDGTKYTNEEASALTLDDIKKMIEAQVPNAFSKKASAKKAAVKKTATKKATSKKSATAKSTSKKAPTKKAAVKKAAK